MKTDTEGSDWDDNIEDFRSKRYSWVLNPFLYVDDVFNGYPIRPVAELPLH